MHRPVVNIVLVLAMFAVACTSRSDDGESSPAPETTEEVASETTAPSESARVPRFDDAPCLFSTPADYAVRCGWLVTHEDRDDPDGRQVRLHVGIFSSKDDEAGDDSADAEPLVYLEGGPGGHALDGAALGFEARFGAYVAARDVIVFDQRGTGHSEPSLACETYRERVYDGLDERDPPAEKTASLIDALGECATGFRSEGIDLTKYNSIASAGDVADLAASLGHDHVQLLGVSYGTRLAQTILREHPSLASAVVLDSAYPTSVDGPVELGARLRASFERFFDACESDSACARAHPDLEERFWTLVALLDAEPVEVEARDLLTDDDPVRVLVSGTDLVSDLFQSLYEPSLLAAFPGIIADLEAGDTAGLAALSSINLTQLSFFSIGMHVSVQCNEELRFTDPDRLAEAIAAHPEFAPNLESQIVDGPAGFDTCEGWASGEAPAAENEPVRSSTPTLVLAGGFDPITPPEWGELVADTLTRSQFVLFPTLGHGVSLSEPCPADIVNQFLDAPTTRVDTSCVGSIDPPRWDGTDQGDIELESFTLSVVGTRIESLRPTGWDEVASGGYARQATALDPTALVVQALPGFALEDAVKELKELLPFGGELDDIEPIEIGERSWERLSGPLDEASGGGRADLAVAIDGEDIVYVLLISSSEERDALVGSVLEPVLAGTRVAG